jgi:hypothetical protein
LGLEIGNIWIKSYSSTKSWSWHNFINMIDYF